MCLYYYEQASSVAQSKVRGGGGGQGLLVHVHMQDLFVHDC